MADEVEDSDESERRCGLEVMVVGIERNEIELREVDDEWSQSECCELQARSTSVDAAVAVSRHVRKTFKLIAGSEERLAIGNGTNGRSGVVSKLWSGD